MVTDRVVGQLSSGFVIVSLACAVLLPTFASGRRVSPQERIPEVAIFSTHALSGCMCAQTPPSIVATGSCGYFFATQQVPGAFAVHANTSDNGPYALYVMAWAVYGMSTLLCAYLFICRLETHGTFRAGHVTNTMIGVPMGHPTDTSV